MSLSGAYGRIGRRFSELAATVRGIPFVGRLLVQLVHVNILDMATRMAAQVFLTALPLVFVVAAFAPTSVRNNFLDSLRTVLGLKGASLDEVKSVLGAGQQGGGQSTGFISVVITLLSATACSRALQRLCERSWHVPPAGARLAAWRWVAWLLAWLVVLLFTGRIRSGFGAGLAVGIPLSLIISVLLWWWTQHVLLAGRIAWPPLLPGSVLTGVGLVALAAVAKVYVPHSLDRSVAQFGPLGLVFTLFSWLIVLFTFITVGVASGYVIAHQRPLSRLLGTTPQLADGSESVASEDPGSAD